MQHIKPLVLTTLFIAACTSASSDDIVVEHVERTATGAILRDGTGAQIGRIDHAATGDTVTTTTSLAGHELVRTHTGDTLGIQCHRTDDGAVQDAACEASLDALEMFEADGSTATAGASSLAPACWVRLNQCWDGGYSCNGNGHCTTEQVLNACRSMGERLCTLWGYEQ